ncbi:helix-turn-helix domain-containing protein [archaeon]|nr:helix-turn-helix domain-containing protein [archaeon]
MELHVELKKAGLPDNQAKVYLELIKRGSLSANKLSKNIGLDRTLTYQILNNLLEKGLISYIIKENKKYFEAASPDNLIRPIKEQEKFINSIIPKLKSIKKLEENEQEVKVYEGKKGLKTFFEDILKSKDICIFGATGKSYEILRFEVPHISKKAEKLGIKGRMITSLENKKQEMTKLKNLKVRYLDEVKSPATTTIYKNKVGIHVLSDKPIVIIIKNKDVADGYRSYFNFLWKIAKK